MQRRERKKNLIKLQNHGTGRGYGSLPSIHQSHLGPIPNTNTNTNTKKHPHTQTKLLHLRNTNDTNGRNLPQLKPLNRNGTETRKTFNVSQQYPYHISRDNRSSTNSIIHILNTYHNDRL